MQEDPLSKATLGYDFLLIDYPLQSFAGSRSTNKKKNSTVLETAYRKWAWGCHQNQRLFYLSTDSIVRYVVGLLVTLKEKHAYCSGHKASST